MGTYQTINVGTAANDGTGDPLRTAMIKVNESFANTFADPVITKSVTVGNSTVNAVIANTPSMTFSNSTWSGVINSVAVQFSNTTATSNLNAIQLRIGDGTTAISNTIINASASFHGNTVANVLITSTTISIANGSTGNVNISPGVVNCGANVSINNVSIAAGLATTANLVITAGYVTIANGTTGRSNVEPGKITVGLNASELVTINTSIITTPAANVISNTGFTLGSANGSANGYVYLPNGLKMVWGWVSSNTSAGSVTFNDAFPVAVFSVTATGNTNDYVYITAKTTTGLTVRTTNTTATNVQFIAIGK